MTRLRKESADEARRTSQRRVGRPRYGDQALPGLRSRDNLRGGWVRASETLTGGLILAPMARPVKTTAVTKPVSDDHPLSQSWPPFLDLLDRNLAEGINQFLVFAYKLFQVRLPSILRDQAPEEREDWIQEILLHFTNDDGRVLREYRNTGASFAAWCLTVANRKAHDCYRHAVKQRRHTEPFEDGKNEPEIPLPGDSLDVRMEWQEAIDKISLLLPKMRKKCQILLRAAAEEFKPREMIALLGKDARTNKHASDDLRACRDRLKTLLAREGIDLENLL